MSDTATPARDEANTRTEADRGLREQIAAAVIGQLGRRHYAVDDVTDAVMPVVDAWVAARTAEVERLREQRLDLSNRLAFAEVEVRRFRAGWLHEGRVATREMAKAMAATAAVARVRALCDERSVIRAGELEAILDEPTGGQ